MNAQPDGQLISIEQARRIVLEHVQPLDGEEVEVRLALGRALVEDVVAAHDVPPFDNSAMDGFAVRAAAAETELAIVGESRAGRPWSGVLQDGQAVAISTGAALPAGAEAVVAFERTSRRGDSLTIGIDAQPGLNIRRAGEDMRRGQAVLAAGRRLGAAEVAVAVAAGRGELRCARRPRLAVVTSGDELRAPGAALGPGEIHDSNTAAIEALARLAGAEPRSAGRGIGDEAAATEAALAAALEGADVLVVTGGVSVGAHDHVKGALAALGVQERFWRVALRPGKPTWFGVRDRTLVFGLPGNPVSAMVTFLLFVRPALLALEGLPPVGGRRLATLAEPVTRHPERDEAVRVALRESERGLLAEVTGPQGSHQLTSMLGADGLLVVERGDGELPAGTAVQVEPIALFRG